MKISSVQQYKFQNNSPLASKSKNVSVCSFKSIDRKEEAQIPSCYGMDIVKNGETEKKKGVPVSLGTVRATGEKIVINFSKEFIAMMLLKNTLKGEKSVKHQDLLKPEFFIEKPILKKLPDEAQAFLSELQGQQPDKYKLVHSILKLTCLRTKTAEGVSDEYMVNYVKKLAECHPVLLKNIVDNKIPIRIHDNLMAFNYKIGHAQYAQKQKPLIKDNKIVFDENGCPMTVSDTHDKYIDLVERDYNGPIKIQGKPQKTTDSIPHEFAHAFDYNNGKKLNFTRQDSLTVLLPTPFFIGDNHLRFIDMPSFSKEFDDALALDIIHMMNIDEQNGNEIGTTFKTLLKDENFKYYLGAHQDQTWNKDIIFDDSIARRELFAQLFSYASGAKLTNKEFENRIEELFPNGLEFCRKTLKVAENL